METKALARLVTSVGKVVEARNAVPILSALLLVATADQLTVRGTDLDVEATASGPATCEPGRICVSAKLLGDIVRKVSGTEITLELIDDQLVVKSGRSRFSLATLPASDFPDITAGKYAATFTIDLAALFAPVAFAMSNETTRFYLNGVYLSGNGTVITAVATDGHRLARHVQQSDAVFAGIIVPRKTAGLLSKGQITVSVSGTIIMLAAPELTLISKLVDGTYPDFERVIPKDNDKIATVDRQDFSKAADRVTTVSSERGRAVKLSVAPGSIALSAHSDVGSAEDEVAAEYSDEPMSIGFNSAYLKEALAVLPDGPVKIALVDSGMPAHITSDAANGLDLTLMPMRI
jgi:DNA polymerase-3 subunit beta